MPIRKQVLIVDDNHMNRMILKNILSSTYKCYTSRKWTESSGNIKERKGKNFSNIS